MSRAHSPTFQSLHLRHRSISNPFVALPTSQLIFQHFRCFTYVTAHSPTLPLLSPTSQFILQPFFRFSYVTAELILQPFRHFTYVTTDSPTLPQLYLRHSSFSNPSVASPTSQALRLIHLASRPCFEIKCIPINKTFMYLQYSRPPYLSFFVKCLEGVVHHQLVHLC